MKYLFKSRVSVSHPPHSYSEEARCLTSDMGRNLSYGEFATVNIYPGPVRVRGPKAKELM